MKSRVITFNRHCNSRHTWPIKLIFKANSIRYTIMCFYITCNKVIWGSNKLSINTSITIWVNWSFNVIYPSLNPTVQVWVYRREYIYICIHVYIPRDQFETGSTTVHPSPLARSPWWQHAALSHSIYPPTPINTLIDRLSVNLCAQISWKCAIRACRHTFACVCWML